MPSVRSSVLVGSLLGASLALTACDGGGTTPPDTGGGEPADAYVPPGV